MNQVQKEKYIIEIKFTREKLEYEKTLKVHNLPIKKKLLLKLSRGSALKE